MDKQEKAENIRFCIALVAIFLVCTAILAVFLYGFIRDYLRSDEEKLTFTREALTFEKYEEAHSKAGWYWAVYVKEYETHFRIFTASEAMNEANLARLAENDILDVTFCQEFDDICELSCDGTVILSLPDYLKANRDEQIMGMVCCAFFFQCILFLFWVFLRALGPITDNGGLGKLWIEYTVKGNVIRVYHSGAACSLVINDQIIDQQGGAYGSMLQLKGFIGSMKANGRKIRVEAKLGFCYVRLYCNGEQVAKRFMLLGW